MINWLKRNKREIFQDYDKNIQNLKQKVIPNLQQYLEQAINRAKSKHCDMENLVSCSELYKFFDVLKQFS